MARSGQPARRNPPGPQAGQGPSRSNLGYPDPDLIHPNPYNVHILTRPPPPQIALLAFYGVNHHTSARIMARLQFHDQMRVQDLTEPQLNALSALLSAPAAAPRPSTPLRPFLLSSPSPSSSSSSSSASDLLPRDPPLVALDPLPGLVLEEDLRRARRADIAHHRTVGTLRGRQHAMGLPVRGQRNRTNARTAKKLNRIERRVFSTAASASSSRTASCSPLGRSPVLDALRTLHASSGRPSLSSASFR